MTYVTLYPVRPDIIPEEFRDHEFPEISVLNPLVITVLPAPAFPLQRSLCIHVVTNVFGITVNQDVPTLTWNCLKGLNCRYELHTSIGGGLLASPDPHEVATIDNNGCVSTRARVGVTGTICDDVYLHLDISLFQELVPGLKFF